MANIFDSLDDLFSAIGEKTSGSIEATKLTFYVNSQEKKLAEAQKKIGAYYFTKLLIEGNPDDEILEDFEAAKDAQERIAAAKMRIKELEEIVNAPITPGRKTCPVCGEVVYNGANYCPECGAAFAEDIEPEETANEAEPAEAEETAPEAETSEDIHSDSEDQVQNEAADEVKPDPEDKTEDQTAE